MNYKNPNPTEQRFLNNYATAQKYESLGNLEGALSHYQKALFNIRDIIQKQQNDKKPVDKEDARLVQAIVAKIDAIRKLKPSSSSSQKTSTLTKSNPSEPTKNNEFERVTQTGISFKDVIGSEHIKNFVQEQWIDRFDPHLQTMVVDGVESPIYETEVERGILFYGLPGTGKTMMAKAIASEVNAIFFAIDAKQVLDKYKGETVKTLGRLFDEASKEQRAIVFIDEIDSLLSNPTQETQQHEKVDLNQWLSLMDGINSSKYKNVLFIGTTNFPNSIASSALRTGRLGVQFRVDLPNLDIRRKMIGSKIKSDYIDGEVDYDSLALRLAGYTTSDIIAICNRIVDLRSRKLIQLRKKGVAKVSSNEVAVTEAEINELMALQHSSIAERSMSDIDEFEKNYNIKNPNGTVYEYRERLYREK